MSDFEPSDFEIKVKASLNADLANLDADTRAQLATARRKALNQAAKKSWLNKDYWLPAGSLALCSLLAVLVWVNPTPQSAPNNVAANAQTNEALNQVAAIELLTEADDETIDPDFYLWADEALAES